MIYAFRELTELTFLNCLIKWHKDQTINIKKSINDVMDLSGLNRLTDNTFKICAVSLQRQFKKLGVQLFETNANIAQDDYIITEEAWDFIVANLHDEIYDENGEKKGEYFLHPNKLTGEMMI